MTVWFISQYAKINYTFAKRTNFKVTDAAATSPPLPYALWASSSHRGEEFHLAFDAGCCSQAGIRTSGAACSALLLLRGGFTNLYSSTRSDIDGTKVCGSARGLLPMSIMPSTSFSQRSAVAARTRTFGLPPAAPPTSFEAPRPPPERSATDAAATLRACCARAGGGGGRGHECGCRHARMDDACKCARAGRAHPQLLCLLHHTVAILRVLAGDPLPELGLLIEAAAELGHDLDEAQEVVVAQREAARVHERLGGSALRLVEPHGELTEPRHFGGLRVHVEHLWSWARGDGVTRISGSHASRRRRSAWRAPLA